LIGSERFNNVTRSKEWKRGAQRKEVGWVDRIRIREEGGGPLHRHVSAKYLWGASETSGQRSSERELNGKERMCRGTFRRKHGTLETRDS